MNKSKLEVLVGAAGPGACRINAEIARAAYQFTFRGETIRATTAIECPGCQVESQGNTRAEAQMRVIKAQTRYSCRPWAPRSIGLRTKIRLWQTLVRSIAVCSRTPYVASEGRGNAGKVAKPCITSHCKVPWSYVSRAHAGLPKEAWGTHSSINAASSEATLGKEMVA